MWINYFKMTVFCARHRFYFRGVCYNLGPISFSFYSVSTRSFPAYFAQKLAIRRDFLNKFMDASCPWTCDPEEFTTKCSPILSSGTTFYTRLVQKKLSVLQYT
jgi:hypothetical protein